MKIDEFFNTTVTDEHDVPGTKRVTVVLNVTSREIVATKAIEVSKNNLLKLAESQQRQAIAKVFYGEVIEELDAIVEDSLNNGNLEKMAMQIKALGERLQKAGRNH